MLKEYYKKVKNILQKTTAISQTEQEEFLVEVEQYIADLDHNRYTILIAGKTNDCYSCLTKERPDGSYRNNIVRHSVTTEKYWSIFSILTGETSAGKSSLINLLLSDCVLPTCITQNTHTICEISYGTRKEAVLHFSKASKPVRIIIENTFAEIKDYIETPVEDEHWCKKIEIKIPNPLLKVQKNICLYQRFQGKISYFFVSQKQRSMAKRTKG